MLKEERQLKTRIYKNENMSILNQNESSLKIDKNITISMDKGNIKGIVIDQVNYYDE